MSETTTRRDVYAIVTERITEQLETGTVPWRKPWAAPGALPMSVTTGKPYRGLNVFLLGGMPYASQWWGTYKVLGERGGQVRKGERSSIVVLWRPIERKPADDNREPGEMTLADLDKPKFMLRYYSVFNVEQCDWADGMPAKFDAPAPVSHEWDAVGEAESLANGYVTRGPQLNVKRGDAANYSPVADRVTMPERDQFDRPEGWYETLFHELGHSTGHQSRLARPGVCDPVKFGSHKYAAEELVAEMTAAYLCGMAGIERGVLDNSAAYIAGWLKALRDDRRMVVHAASQAQRAADLIIGETIGCEIAA